MPLGAPAPLPGYDLETLYRRYAGPLTQFCRGRLNGDFFEAEDACHEALLRAERALHSMRPRALWPWLATIAANVCTDLIRKRSRLVGFDAGSAPAASSDPEQEAMARIRAQLVTRALEEVPAPQREVIRLHYYEGMSYEDIARLRGTTVGAVGSALLRARRALRAQIRKLARKAGQGPLYLAALVAGCGGVILSTHIGPFS